MPRPRPPHLHRETSRHGKTVWYVRVDKGRVFASIKILVRLSFSARINLLSTVIYLRPLKRLETVR